MFTDSHCHLSNEDYDDIKEIVASAVKNGINRLIISGCDIKSNLEIISLSKEYDNIYFTLGCHPNCIEELNECINIIRDNINNPKFIAIGEIGLDYHFEGYVKKNQIESFNQLLTLAKSLNKPVVIHSRDAIIDTYEILKKYNLKGVIHSFQGNLESAQKYISLGYLLGINGTVTFKNSNLLEILKSISVEKILLETDSPYLTPVPFRGTKNEPKNILLIVDFLTGNLPVSKEELAIITNRNIALLFDI